MSEPIRILSGLGDIADRYDGFILDLWGVIHDGVTPYPDAVDTLERLKAEGKHYVMLSNAPRRADGIAEGMVAIGIPPALCGPIMSSGEATWRALRDRDEPWFAALGRRCLHIGPDRDHGLFDGLGLERVTRVAEADFIVNTGPWHDEESVADYEDRLRAAAARGLGMICANPDLEVIRGGVRIICAGALAARYEALGGAVRYLGKPDPAIYDACMRLIPVPDRARLAAIGDSLLTDVAGARAAGIDSVLVTSGIHADELGVAPGETPRLERVQTACSRSGQKPMAVLPSFRW